MNIKTIEWKNNAIKIIDQTKLPGKLEYLYINDLRTLWKAIRQLQVRGAPALGAAAALGAYLGIKNSKAKNFTRFSQELDRVARYIASSRPTARNLFWALERVCSVAVINRHKPIAKIKKLIFSEAQRIIEEDKAFANMLVDILKEAKPALTVVDGIVAMEGDSPSISGKLRQTNLLLASADCVALDSVLALIMGIQPERVLTTKEAAARNLGVADIHSINILGEPLDKVIGKPFLLPAASAIKKVPLPIINIAKNLLKLYPCVEHDKCIRCATCIKACPNNVISMKNNRISFDYRRCIACFCCQEVCPVAAIRTKKSLVAKLMGL